MDTCAALTLLRRFAPHPPASGRPCPRHGL